MRPAASKGIFISYRREETAYPAGWLFDRLVSHFGQAQVFKDVDSIEPGDDFVETITAAVGSCDVLLALIGDQWLTLTDANGRRRLDDPNDFVRLEIEAALSRDIRVIPVLVEGARMPRPDELPPTLSGLVRRQSLELSPSRFAADLGRLLNVLDKTLADTARDQQAEPPASAAGEISPVEKEAVSSERAPNRLRGLVSTPKRLAAVVAAALILLAVVIVLAGRDGGGSSPPSEDESPPSEEAPPPTEEGAWPTRPSFLAEG